VLEASLPFRFDKLGTKAICERQRRLRSRWALPKGSLIDFAVILLGRTVRVDSDDVDGVLPRAEATWVQRLDSALRLGAKRSLVAFWRAGCLRLDVGGLRFYIHHGSDESIKQASANLKTAVGLLDRYDRVRFRRICHDLKNGIIVFPTRGTARAEYHRDIDVCFLRSDYAASGHPGFIALSIVHEATHARMRRLSQATAERRARMEQICIGAQIAFASRVPGVSATIDELRARQSSVRVSDFT
jgi:hypothetical protein